MVASNVFHQIHRRLEEIKGTIAVGDLYQLPPVGGNFVFDLPKDPYARLHKSLWSTFLLAELTTVMRQKNKKQFVEILNRVNLYRD